MKSIIDLEGARLEAIKAEHISGGDYLVEGAPRCGVFNVWLVKQVTFDVDLPRRGPTDFTYEFALVNAYDETKIVTHDYDDLVILVKSW